MKWALARQLIEEDPSAAVKAPLAEIGWLRDMESRRGFRSSRRTTRSAPSDGFMFSLALNTGQRRGDLILIGRQHFRRGVLHLERAKTRTRVEGPGSARSAGGDRL